MPRGRGAVGSLDGVTGDRSIEVKNGGPRCRGSECCSRSWWRYDPGLRRRRDSLARPTRRVHGRRVQGCTARGPPNRYPGFWRDAHNNDRRRKPHERGPAGAGITAWGPAECEHGRHGCPHGQQRPLQPVGRYVRPRSSMALRRADDCGDGSGRRGHEVHHFATAALTADR